MNNPMDMMRAMSPQQFLNQMMGSSRIMQDPRAQRAVNLIQHNDTEGLRNMAENLCREYGVKSDDVKAQVMEMFGIRQNGNPGPFA